MTLLLKPRGSNSATAQIENDKLVYHNAYPSTDSLNVVSNGRSEEFLLLHDARAPQKFEYDLSSVNGVKNVSLRDNSVYFTNAQGQQLQIEAPWLIESGGQKVANAVHWQLSYSNGTSLPRLTLAVNTTEKLRYPVVIDPTWVVTNGSLNTARLDPVAVLLNNGLVLVVGGDLATAELYNPTTGSFAYTGTMMHARGGCTATLLLNGRVLVAGGADDNSATAELYDPVSGTFAPTGTMTVASIYFHTATLLNNGMVLVAGGTQRTGGGDISACELYNPSTNTWSATGSLPFATTLQTATLLNNGQVLVAGGGSDTSNIASAAIYNPSTSIWTLTGSMNTPRTHQFATLLQNGQVLIGGGFNYPGYYNTLTSAELYNPATGTFSYTGSMNSIHFYASTSLLPNGQVLVMGGGSTNTNISTTEIYNPSTGTWSVSGNLNTPRYLFGTSLLPNGEVFVVGGGNASSSALSSAEIYDPAVGTFTTTGSLNGERASHTATLLPNGQVLIAGGYGNSGLSTSAELFNPANGTWTATSSLNTARAQHTATLLPNGQVLVAGGYGNSGYLTSAELFDPSSQTWTVTANLNTARENHCASLLPNGDVLVEGGNGNSGLLTSAELFNPVTGTWTATANLNTARAQHTATLLPNGQVVVEGGNGSSGYLTSAELYNPATATWTATGSLNTARAQHTATLLPNGQVLVAGGYGSSGYLTSAELFDPSSQTWTATANLNTARNQQTATLLPNGQVLVAAGFGNSGCLTSAELYNPATSTWTATGSLNTARAYHTATLLTNGQVLLAGGYGISKSPITSAELFNPGLGYNSATQPQINPVTSASSLLPLSITGTNFTGVSEASGGATNNSASNIPVVQLESLANEQIINVPLSSNSGFTSTSFASLPPTGLIPGYAMLTMFVNGTPSISQIVPYSTSTPAITSPATASATVGSSFAYQITGTNYPISYNATGLPPGLFVSTSSGVINGTPSNPGVYAATITATNYSGSTNGTLVLTVSPAPLTFSSANSPGITANGYNAAGESLSLTLAYAPAPGDVLTVINNTSANPIVGKFNNLTDGGTIGLIYNGTTYYFTANYEGGDGNDLTLTYDLPTSQAPRPPSPLTILHTFGDGSVINDGATPGAGSLIMAADGNFYGTTSRGGISDGGCVYQTTHQGQVVVLHRFGSGPVVDLNGNAANDGLQPASGIVQGLDGNFYGTTSGGGSANKGTIFRITSLGQVTILHSFGDGSVTSDGVIPQASLVQGSDGNFYGTTSAGGTANVGTVYKITPLGQLTILHSFGDGSVASDGSSPGTAALVQGSDGNFYSTCASGSAGYGCAYKITPVGVMTILHSFSAGGAANDGATPDSGFVQGPDGSFYGTTYSFIGSINKQGCVYKMTPQGQVTLLHGFKDGTLPNDGTLPYAGLYLSADGNYYGTTTHGGSTAGSPSQLGSGTVFQITPQGVTTILHNFGDGSVPNDGTIPTAGLIQGSDGNLYGVTSSGGSTGLGTLFKLNLNLPSITSGLTANGTVNVPLNYQATGTNSPSAYAATNLPAGLSINPTSGLVSGTPTSVGTTTAIITLTNAQGSSSFPVNFSIGSLAAPTITSILTSFGSVGGAFNYTITAYNNVNTYGATGLPPGLAINAATGVIYGTPTVVGTSDVLISATNATGTTSATLSIQVTGYPPTLGQEYVVIHRFADGSVVNDAKEPTSIFGGFDGTLYGTSTLGGSDTNGAIFNMTVQGTTTILNSTGGGGQGQSLVQGSDGNFYGTTVTGGSSGNGTIFKMSPLGVRTILHYFGDGTTPNDGISPNAALIQAFDGSFYGTTSGGGTSGKGTVFKITTLGAVTIIHNFGDGTVAQDGAIPGAGLYQISDGTVAGTFLYGTTQAGGFSGKGTIFKMTTLGVETILHHFGDGSVVNDGIPGASNGAPSLVQGFDGNFYGVTSTGGANNQGVVYAMTPSGSVTILHSFGDGSVTSDGSNPEASLVSGYDGNLYGTTLNGGSASLGTVFEITPTGTVVIIHSFGDGTVANDGANPVGSLYQDGSGNFYGTAASGGVSGGGVAFAVVASQATSHVPVFIGSSTIISPVLAPVTFIPKVAYGTSGSGSGISGMFVKAGGPGQTNGKISKSFALTSWTLSPPNGLPNYMSFDPTTGIISGTPIQSGIFNLVMTAKNGAGTSDATTITLYIDVAPILSGPNSAEAFVGTPFSYQIAALANPTSFGATGMPEWMSVDQTVGIISGTPPDAGTFPFNATASNVSGTATQHITLTVGNPPPASPVITSSPSTTATVGTAFNYQITATHSPTGYGALSLPPGLVFNSMSGTIAGTPTSVGTFNTSISASNIFGNYTSNLQIVVAPITVPQITSSTSITGVYNTPMSYQIEASGLPSLYSASNLPAGLTLNTATGAITGTPTVIGTATVALTATNIVGTGTAPLAIVVQPPLPNITSSLAVTTTAGTIFSYQIGAANSPTSYGASGLPTGLQLNTMTGAITGKPTVTGTYSVTLSATNSYGMISSTLSLTVAATLQAPVISSATTASGTTNTPFSYQVAASNSPFSYSATGLPGGLSINGSSGLISGTQTTPGSFPVTITATNATATATAHLTITITQVAPSISSPISATGTIGTSFSYQITASLEPTSYNALDLPTGLQINTATGLIFGVPTVTGTFPVTISATNQAGSSNTTLKLIIVDQPPAPPSTDTPTMPPIALLVLGLLLIAAGSKAALNKEGRLFYRERSS